MNLLRGLLSQPPVPAGSTDEPAATRPPFTDSLPGDPERLGNLSIADPMITEPDDSAPEFGINMLLKTGQQHQLVSGTVGDVLGKSADEPASSPIGTAKVSVHPPILLQPEVVQDPAEVYQQVCAQARKTYRQTIQPAADTYNLALMTINRALDMSDGSEAAQNVCQEAHQAALEEYETVAREAGIAYDHVVEAAGELLYGPVRPSMPDAETFWTATTPDGQLLGIYRTREAAGDVWHEPGQVEFDLWSLPTDPSGIGSMRPRQTNP